VAFRVAQEALTNSVKHAQATRVSVSLQRQADTVVLTIQDNGIGFDTTQALSRRGHAASWGLLGIRERALLLGGTYEIRSAPGQGTLIRIHAPVPGGGEMLPSQEDLTQIVPT
jgi:signal transduction histidine kinase